MTALLEMPAICDRVARLSVADYHRLGELPVELIRGTIIAKMSKSPLPTFILQSLREILTTQVDSANIVFQESPLTTDDSEPEPDICVVRGPKAQYRTTHPTTAELVIEVAVSSIDLDRVKADIYAEAGVKEYWIVCPEEKRVEIYRQSSPAAFAAPVVVENPGTIESTALPGVSVDFAALLA